MKPAYHISLTAQEKRLITELAAIQSQIEWLMQITVGELLEISPPAFRLVMGSTSLAINAQIWLEVVREKHPLKAHILPWAEYVFGEMEAMAKGRNDFLHTLYGVQTDADPASLAFNWGHVGDKLDRGKTRSGVRVKNAARVSLDELRGVRERAAYLSIATAHVEWTASDPLGDGGSPWLRRLGGPLPPPKGEAGFRKATRPPPRPRSSRG
jgi:hypothetical protein